MKPSIHALVSISLGALFWYFSKSLYAGVLCAACGIFVDIDHIVEYLIHYGGKGFTVRKFLHAFHEMLFDKLYVFFHSIEIVIILWIVVSFTQNIYAFAAALGISTHLILDFAGNPLHFFSYFIARRIARGFKTDALVRDNHPLTLRRRRRGKN